MTDANEPEDTRDAPQPERPDTTEGLEDELRQLFQDDRLSLPVRTGAADAVVSLAGRRHRRQVVWASAAAVLAVLAVVSAGIASVALSKPSSVQIAEPGLNTTSSVTAPPAPSDDGSGETTQPVDGAPPTKPSIPPKRHTPAPPTASQNNDGILLGPHGYDQLIIGMSEQAAENTGLLADNGSPNGTQQPTTGAASSTTSPPPPPTCDVRQLAADPSVTVTFVSGRGLVQISANNAHTPDGVGTGSTADQVNAAYPNADGNDKMITVFSGSLAYDFWLDNGVVSQLALRVASGFTCATS